MCRFLTFYEMLQSFYDEVKRMDLSVVYYITWLSRVEKCIALHLGIDHDNVTKNVFNYRQNTTKLKRISINRAKEIDRSFSLDKREGSICFKYLDNVFRLFFKNDLSKVEIYVKCLRWNHSKIRLDESQYYG